MSKKKLPKISRQTAYLVIILTVLLILSEIAVLKKCRDNGCVRGMYALLEGVYGPANDIPKVEAKLSELCTEVLKR